MSDFEDNVQILKGIVGGITHTKPVRALTGALASDGTVISDPALNADGVRLDFPYMYVRIDGNRRETRAINVRTYDRLSNMPVKVANRVDTGELEITEIDVERGQVTLGDAIAAANTPRPMPQLNATKVAGRDFVPGRATFEQDLDIRVEAFPYIDTDGNEKYWPGTALLDLTSSVPATSNYHGLVRISLNPDADSPALVATAGTTKTNVAIFQREETLNIALPEFHLSLAVVRLENGDTAPDDNRIWDWRYFSSEGSRDLDILNTRAEPVVGSKTIASGRSAVWASPVTISGTLTIAGNLMII